MPQIVDNFVTMASPEQKLHCHAYIFGKIDLVHVSGWQISQEKILKCYSCSARRPNMSPSQSSFRLEAIYQLDLFAKWTCICEICFSDFLPILISAGDCFWQLDLYEKWSCIYEWRVFSNFVPILISAGGILTNWICSQSDQVFAVEGFLISFLSSLWQECRYASKTTNLKQLLLTSKFTFWPQQLLWYSTATSNHQICFLEPQSRTWKKRHQRCM